MSCFCRFILLKRRLICKIQFRCVILVHVHRTIRRKKEKKSESKSLFKVQLSRRLRGSLNDRPVPSSMDLSIGYCHPATISNDFTSENAGPIVTKFRIKPSWHVGIKGLHHMTNMATTHIEGKKTLKKTKNKKTPLQVNKSTDDLETWYVLLSIQALPILIRLCPLVDPDLLLQRKNVIRYFHTEIARY